MKRIFSLFLLLVIALSANLLCGCSDKKDDKEFLMLQPTYVGDAVTDTNHTFEKEDFKVFACYDQNITEEVTDFTFEIADLRSGYYTVLIKWNGHEEECYIPLQLDIYE